MAPVARIASFGMLMDSQNRGLQVERPPTPAPSAAFRCATSPGEAEASWRLRSRPHSETSQAALTCQPSRSAVRLKRTGVGVRRSLMCVKSSGE